MQQYPHKYDLLPKLMIQQQQWLLQQQGNIKRESNSNSQRKIMNPMMVEYQTLKEKSFPMYRPAIMVGEVHYGQNL
jgi:hypothetical protein